jgi:hypothetical protein
VVHDEIDDHAQAEVGCFVEELDEVAEGTEPRRDRVVVGDVVAVVTVRRGMDRVQPQRRDAETRQVIQP